jgi:hypothetical protein
MVMCIDQGDKVVVYTKYVWASGKALVYISVVSVLNPKTVVLVDSVLVFITCCTQMLG